VKNLKNYGIMITKKGIVYCKFCGSEVRQKKKGQVKRYCDEICKSRYYHQDDSSKASALAGFLEWAIDKKVALMPGGIIQLAYEDDTWQSVANEYIGILKGRKLVMKKKKEAARMTEQPKRVAGAPEPVRQPGEGAIDFAIRRQEWQLQRDGETELHQYG